MKAIKIKLNGRELVSAGHVIFNFLIYYRFEYKDNFYKFGFYYTWVQMLLQIGSLLRLGSKCYYGWHSYYAWVQMLLQMGPLLQRMALLLRLGPNVITDGTFITLGFTILLRMALLLRLPYYAPPVLQITDLYYAWVQKLIPDGTLITLGSKCYYHGSLITLGSKCYYSHLGSQYYYGWHLLRLGPNVITDGTFITLGSKCYYRWDELTNVITDGFKMLLRMALLLRLGPNVITDNGWYSPNVITITDGTLITLGSKCYYRWDLYYTWVQLLHLWHHQYYITDIKTDPRGSYRWVSGKGNAVTLARAGYIDDELTVYNSITVSQKSSQPGASEHNFGAPGHALMFGGKLATSSPGLFP